MVHAMSEMLHTNYHAICCSFFCTSSVEPKLIGLCANWSDHNNHGPAIENRTKPIHMLSPGTTDLEIVHPYVYTISLRVLHNSASLRSVIPKFWYCSKFIINSFWSNVMHCCSPPPLLEIRS